MVRVVVLGGGAAGFFGAIRAAELGAEVTVLEATGEPLQKVRISGGGRCNVTHRPIEPARFVASYPRGEKEMRSVLARFSASDTMAWFESRGVALKIEEDGRVFPVSDDSGSIVDALLAAARAAGVATRTKTRVAEIRRESGFRLALRDGGTLHADRVLLATGSNPEGLRLASALGHHVEPPVPALFSLQVRDPRLAGLAGVAVSHVRAKLEVEGAKRPVEKEGPLLVTHQGVSGPAILRVSSIAARDLAAAGYRGALTIDFAPAAREEDMLRRAAEQRAAHPKGTVGAHPFTEAVPRRLFESIASAAGLDPGTRWSEAPKKALLAAVSGAKRARFEVVGKGDFREEIVTCGGVARREVDWTRMESRLAPGLHLAGEILDVDALTGGFNLQHAWSTGWIAGSALGAPPP